MTYRRIRRSTSDQRQGFTLLELLLVMAILVVLAGASGFAILQMRTGAMTRAAYVEIETLERMCQAYNLSVGRFPTTLEDLYTLPSGMNQALWGGPYLDKPVPVDPWQQEYTYSIDSINSRVTIKSAGKDGQLGTNDDIPDAVTQ